ncbi:hypothetical protein PINS_up006633 [Pythium insidiosum]|nr:hypothetical protein PINS_up006633 [Pythium insidiosum]
MPSKLLPNQSPFAPLQLTTAQRESFAALANELIDETLREYDHHVRHSHRVMDKAQWKEVKHRDQLAIYKRISAADARDSDLDAVANRGANGDTTPTPQWSLPKLVGVGSLAGTLEDVMYGLLSPDDATLRIRMTYIEDEVRDGRVLAVLQAPSAKDPFRLMAIKWAVKAQASALGRPRDLVLLEATGITTTTSDGERVGYAVRHSVALPGCPELTQDGIVRARISVGYVFRQLTPDRVDVYVRSFVDAGGNAPERAVLASSVNGIAACWRLLWCAQNKKLAFLMRETTASRTLQRSRIGDPIAIAKPSKCCSLCSKNVSGFRTLTACELCLSRVCAKCLTGRKLTYVRRSGEILQVPTGFCATCLTRATNLNAAHVAKIEHAQEWDDECSSEHAPSPRRVAIEDVVVATAGARRTCSVIEGSDLALLTSAPQRQSEEYARPLDVQTLKDWEVTQTSWSVSSSSDAALEQSLVSLSSSSVGSESHHETPTATTTTTAHQQQLWMQMNQLCLAAEETYLLTRRNADAMQDQP